MGRNGSENFSDDGRNGSKTVSKYDGSKNAGKHGNGSQNASWPRSQNVSKSRNGSQNVSRSRSQNASKYGNGSQNVGGTRSQDASQLGFGSENDERPKPDGDVRNGSTLFHVLHDATYEYAIFNGQWNWRNTSRQLQQELLHCQ